MISTGKIAQINSYKQSYPHYPQKDIHKTGVLLTTCAKLLSHDLEINKKIT